MPRNFARIANPFVYGRVLGSQDAACPRSTYERAIEEAVANRGRLALVGDRRLGKSTVVERTHQVLSAPLLHWDFHKVYSAQDLVHRAAVLCHQPESFDWRARNAMPHPLIQVPEDSYGRACETLNQIIEIGT